MTELRGGKFSILGKNMVWDWNEEHGKIWKKLKMGELKFLNYAHWCFCGFFPLLIRIY